MSVILFMNNPVSLFSQNNDSIALQKKSAFKTVSTNDEKKEDKPFFGDHSPKKASLLAIIPGLGQIYNRKYWKVPIVYAGFAVSGYFAITNLNEYNRYKDAYICSSNAAIDTNYVCNNPLAQKYSKENLLSIKDYYRRNAELSFIIMGVWYILQIVDATVDAHLFYWEVSDGVTLKTDPIIRPNIIPGEPKGVYGLKIAVNF